MVNYFSVQCVVNPRARASQQGTNCKRMQIDSNMAGEKLLFPPNAEDKNDSNKLSKRRRIEPFIVANWDIFTLTSVLLTVYCSPSLKKNNKKNISWYCCGPILVYNTLPLKGFLWVFLSLLFWKRGIQIQYSSSLMYSPWRLTACVTDSLA